jgi:hypothetical protein
VWTEDLMVVLMVQQIGDRSLEKLKELGSMEDLFLLMESSDWNSSGWY